ncbi:MAG: hypothetical protein ACYC6Y_15385 [Thermoguttaceae bacterium]
MDREKEAQKVLNGRRAGLRPDERDPDDPPGPAGSAAGGKNMSGIPPGGLAAGGLGGTNSPSGAIDGEVDELTNAYGDGTQDISGSEEIADDPPYSGPSGGAVGGTPAGKRVNGGGIRPGQGLVPGADHTGDGTVGKNATVRRSSGESGDDQQFSTNSRDSSDQ